MHPVRLFGGPDGSAGTIRHPLGRFVRRGRGPAALVAATLLVGCVQYVPEPLSPESALLELRERSLDDVHIVELPGAGPETEVTFDSSDGLSEAELVSVALTLHPRLREKRSALGESEALLITAGLWPNPELSVSLRNGLGAASGIGAGLDVLFELLRPGERAARKAVATARIDAAHAELGAEEYRVAAEARKARVELLAAERLLRANEDEASLRDEAFSMLERRRSLGEATTLDLALLELERAEAQRGLREARGEVDLRRRSLLAALGLPPGFEVRLSDASLELTLFHDLSDEELDQALLSRRLDLRMEEAAYRAAEEELRLAVARQRPSLSVGPSFEREVEGTESLGVAASSEIPVFNRNEGEIAEKTAARARARARYSALLFELRREAFEARASLRRAREEWEAQEREVRPLVERTDALFTAAFEARELTAFEWTAARGRTLSARRELLRTFVRYVSAAAELEAATGGPLPREASKESLKEQRR